MRNFISSCLLALGLSGIALGQTFEAENGTLSGVTVSTEVTGFTGTGYIVRFENDGASVTWNATIPAAGPYAITARYRAPYGEKYAPIIVQGSEVGQVHFLAGENFTNADALTINLPAGAVTIGVGRGWGWFELDSITVKSDSVGGSTNLTYAPIDSQATAEARNLLKYIQKQYGNNYLSGQQDAAGVAWIEQNVGKTPAILGSDFMDYSPSRVEHGTNSTSVEDIIAFDARNGINAITWHWNAPNCLYDTEENPWWSGFYTRATCFDFAAALASAPNGANYTLLLRDIDAIAVQLKRVANARIPLLFRPLHEPEGGWFWWGTHGPDSYKQLWNLLYTRIKNYHRLHNILWVCNTANASWYPGNNLCDIASTDIYANAGDHGSQSGGYNSLRKLTNGQRVIALAEVGVIPDPDDQVYLGVPWAYWTTWSGDFLTNGQYNSLDFLKKAYNHAKVITLDELPKGWKRGVFSLAGAARRFVRW